MNTLDTLKHARNAYKKLAGRIPAGYFEEGDHHTLQLIENKIAELETAQDAQLLETRKFEAKDIARIFGLPPHMLEGKRPAEKVASWLKRPHDTLHPEQPAHLIAATKTLAFLGYTYHGGEQWKPPLGKRPAQDEPVALINYMVNRFLGWKLPKNFCPDSFISFDRQGHDRWGGYPHSWPVGTNLLDAEQAKAMFRHCIEGYTSPPKQEPQPCPYVMSTREGTHHCSLSAREWVGLTDEDRKAAFESMPDMLDGFLKKWGWLHFSKAIEARLKQKNGF